jgi:TFIIH basal transcription factor complex TTD-A subunit
VLIECEPAIKSIIVHLDSANNDIIIEDLDETHLVVKENMVQVLKQKLEDVSATIANFHLLTPGQAVQLVANCDGKSVLKRRTVPRSRWRIATRSVVESTVYLVVSHLFGCWFLVL